MSKSFTFMDVVILGRKVKYESSTALKSFDLKVIRDENKEISDVFEKSGKNVIIYKGLVFELKTKYIEVRVSPFNLGEAFGNCNSKYITE